MQRANFISTIYLRNVPGTRSVPISSSLGFVDGHLFVSTEYGISIPLVHIAYIENLKIPGVAVAPEVVELPAAPAKLKGQFKVNKAPASDVK